jgi:hypothetical protein
MSDSNYGRFIGVCLGTIFALMLVMNAVFYS